jgi:hypothetical protein
MMDVLVVAAVILVCPSLLVLLAGAIVAVTRTRSGTGAFGHRSGPRALHHVPAEA